MDDNNQLPDLAESIDMPTFALDLQKPDDIGNLAAEMDVGERLRAGRDLVELIAIDESSYSAWAAKAKNYLKEICENKGPFDYAEQESSDGVESDQVPSTGLTLAAVIQFNGRATDALLSDPQIVKPAKDSDDTSQAVSDWVSEQLRSVDPVWVTDTDLITLHAAVTGLAWRKRWHVKRTNTLHSSFLPYNAVVINRNAPSVERTPRLTERMELYPHEIRPLVASGEWCEFTHNEGTDPQAAVEFFECHCMMDMDGDGIDEPWIATIHCESSELVSLAPRWSATGVTVEDAKGKKKKTVFFKPHMHYEPYKFIPNPDGSFHSLGYGWLLDRYEHAADKLLSGAIDTVESASENGGILGGVTTGLPETINLKRDQVNVIQTDGQPLANNYLPFLVKDLPQSVPTMLAAIVQYADRLTGSTAIMNGAPADMSATMAQGIIQDNSRTHSAIHRRMLFAMTAEIRAMVDMAIDFKLLPDTLTGVRSDMIALSADPVLSTDAHRGALAGYYGSLAEDPYTNAIELRTRMHQLMRVPDPKKLLQQPSEPQMTPFEKAKTQADIVKHETTRAKNDASAVNQYAQAIAALATAAANVQQFMQIIPELAAAVEATPDATVTAQSPISGASTPATPGGGPGMAGPSGDGGLGAQPPNPLGEPAGPMGGGQPAGP